MLDPWIIEEIKRREERAREQDGQGRRLELPLEGPRWDEPSPSADDSTPERGVVVIDL